MVYSVTDQPLPILHTVPISNLMLCLDYLHHHLLSLSEKCLSCTVNALIGLVHKLMWFLSQMTFSQQELHVGYV
jgi:hypothetical protein